MAKHPRIQEPGRIRKAAIQHERLAQADQQWDEDQDDAEPGLQQSHARAGGAGQGREE